MPESPPVRRWVGIHCQECGREDDSNERGWKAYFADIGEVVFYRPECAQREFGDD
jgi:hypothetical protein